MIRGSSAVRILPTTGEMKFISIAPGRKLFKTLYASARNSRLRDSLIENVRDTDMSNCHAVGKRIVARPAFPSVPRAGSANAAGFTPWVLGPADLSRYTAFGTT